MFPEERVIKSKDLEKETAHQYDATSIKVLGGLEAVRKRPAMYIGSTGQVGLHHLVWEVVDNSVDEALAGFCDRVDVTVHSDNSVTVEDNGRGIPVDLHQQEKQAEFHYTGGISEFVKHLNKNKEVLHNTPIHAEADRDEVNIEFALQYNDGYAENVFSFANNINTVDGGTHLSGFRSALTRTINWFGQQAGLFK